MGYINNLELLKIKFKPANRNKLRKFYKMLREFIKKFEKELKDIHKEKLNDLKPE
jgi:hypothetical protein